MERDSNDDSALLSTSGLVQEQLLIVTRHGIRVPFPPIPSLPTSAFSTDPQREWFPNASDWGASKIAALTNHGKVVLQRMGAHVRETLLSNRQEVTTSHADDKPAKPRTGRSIGVTVYADRDATSRDIQTAQNFMQGAFPGANVTINSPPNYVKWLFNQGNWNFTGINQSGCSYPTKEYIEGEIGGNAGRLSTEAEVGIMSLSKALKCCQPSVCTAGPGRSGRQHAGANGDMNSRHIVSSSPSSSNNNSTCTLMDIPTRYAGQSKYWTIYTGPLYYAATLSEYVQLLYLNNMDYQQLIPTSTLGDIEWWMRLHEEVMAIADDYYIAARSGSELLVHLAATMQERITGKHIDGLLGSPENELVYYAGHDINIYFLRRLLGLNWLTESFNPNESPTGGMLQFGLYTYTNATINGDMHQSNSRMGGQYYVRAYFMSQSYEQQRTASVLGPDNPASRVFAVIPECSGGPAYSCPFDDFRRLVLDKIKDVCVQLVDPAVLSK